ncbi:MAG: hypothetical protein A2Z47_11610 [Thermodesulfovibrio sp. RBG_19FT_COMBO_42_12]|nr:MAG: hypothetical protein A2Z47_11610 [Thermodesulfovibrio sp. RBG_19FT_COMBO_42_12]HZX47774.1 hypothetical protein [Nitrospirota bacterium]
MSEINWDIRREGREWSRDEAMDRWKLTPEKIEMHEGKIFWSDKERLNMLGLLLENVGIDQAIRLGNPAIWRAAIAGLEG